VFFSLFAPIDTKSTGIYLYFLWCQVQKVNKTPLHAKHVSSGVFYIQKLAVFESDEQRTWF